MENSIEGKIYSDAIDSNRKKRLDPAVFLQLAWTRPNKPDLKTFGAWRDLSTESD
jgi:hypothetical protein